MIKKKKKIKYRTKKYQTFLVNVFYRDKYPLRTKLNILIKIIFYFVFKNIIKQKKLL